MEALAQLVGTTASQINKLEKRQRRLTDDWLVKLSQALKCSPGDLLGDAPVRAPLFGEGVANHVFIPECSLQRVDEDGPGAGIGHFREFAVFKAGWISGLGQGDVESLVVYIVEDDSMEPTLRPGDHVVAERTEDAMRGDGIYVIRMQPGLAIKRVVFAPDGEFVSVISDNRAYPGHERVARSDIRLVARVVWIGRRL